MQPLQCSTSNKNLLSQVGFDVRQAKKTYGCKMRKKSNYNRNDENSPTRKENDLVTLLDEENMGEFKNSLKSIKKDVFDDIRNDDAENELISEKVKKGSKDQLSQHLTGLRQKHRKRYSGDEMLEDVENDKESDDEITNVRCMVNSNVIIDTREISDTADAAKLQAIFVDKVNSDAAVNVEQTKGYNLTAGDADVLNQQKKRKTFQIGNTNSSNQVRDVNKVNNKLIHFDGTPVDFGELLKETVDSQWPEDNLVEVQQNTTKFCDVKDDKSTENVNNIMSSNNIKTCTAYNSMKADKIKCVNGTENEKSSIEENSKFKDLSNQHSLEMNACTESALPLSNHSNTPLSCRRTKLSSKKRQNTSNECISSDELSPTATKKQQLSDNDLTSCTIQKSAIDAAKDVLSGSNDEDKLVIEMNAAEVFNIDSAMSARDDLRGKKLGLSDSNFFRDEEIKTRGKNLTGRMVSEIFVHDTEMVTDNDEIAASAAGSVDFIPDSLEPLEEDTMNISKTKRSLFKGRMQKNENIKLKSPEAFDYEQYKRTEEYTCSTDILLVESKNVDTVLKGSKDSLILKSKIRSSKSQWDSDDDLFGTGSDKTHPNDILALSSQDLPDIPPVASLNFCSQIETEQNLVEKSSKKAISRLNSYFDKDMETDETIDSELLRHLTNDEFMYSGEKTTSRSQLSKKTNDFEVTVDRDDNLYSFHDRQDMHPSEEHNISCSAESIVTLSKKSGNSASESEELNSNAVEKEQVISKTLDNHLSTESPSLSPSIINLQKCEDEMKKHDSHVEKNLLPNQNHHNDLSTTIMTEAKVAIDNKSSNGTLESKLGLTSSSTLAVRQADTEVSASDNRIKMFGSNVVDPDNFIEEMARASSPILGIMSTDETLSESVLEKLEKFPKKPNWVFTTSGMNNIFQVLQYNSYEHHTFTNMH